MLKLFKKSINKKIIGLLLILSTVVIAIFVANILAMHDMQKTMLTLKEALEIYGITSDEEILYLVNHAYAKSYGTMNFDFSLSIAWLGLIALVIYRVKKSIVQPIVKISEDLNVIITGIENGEGDLTVRIETDNVDEIGQLANDINNFIEGLQRLIRSVAKTSDLIINSAMTINDEVTISNNNVLNVSSVAEELSASVEETTATLEQISSGSQQILNNVITMNNNALSSVNDMVEIKNKAEHLELETQENRQNSLDTITELTALLNVAIEESKTVEQINDLTKQILTISSQTNLLALNASIEAAHAGEAGKGFAVVAGEIRNLAEGTKDTANNIQEINLVVIEAVNKLAETSNKMVNLMNTSIIKDYDKFVSIAGQYKNDAECINSMMQNVSTQSQEIKDTMLLMNTGINDITSAMEDSANGINSVAEDISNLANILSSIQEETASNKDVSDKLKLDVSRFKKF